MVECPPWSFSPKRGCRPHNPRAPAGTRYSTRAMAMRCESAVNSWALQKQLSGLPQTQVSNRHAVPVDVGSDYSTRNILHSTKAGYSSRTKHETRNKMACHGVSHSAYASQPFDLVYVHTLTSRGKNIALTPSRAPCRLATRNRDKSTMSRGPRPCEPAACVATGSHRAPMPHTVIGKTKVRECQSISASASPLDDAPRISARVPWPSVAHWVAGFHGIFEAFAERK